MEKENKTILNVGISDTPHSRVNQICCSLVSQEQKGDTLHITAEFQISDECCPFCGSSELKVHAKSQATYIDRPLNDCKVRIRIRRPRMKCQHCRKTFTPAVPGIVERHRVTQGFVEYMRVNLLYHTSIRDFSKRSGVEPKTVTAIIGELCAEYHACIEVPETVGITRFPVANNTLMLYFSLDKKAMLDVSTHKIADSSSAGYEISSIVHSDNLSELFVPADFEFVEELAKQVDVAKMKISLSAIEDLASLCIERNIEKWFGRGIPNKVGKHKAKALTYIRKNLLHVLDTDLLFQGISENNIFCKAYLAKEKLLTLLEDSCPNALTLDEIVTRWLHELDLETKPVFSELGMILDNLNKKGVQFSNNREYNNFTSAIGFIRYILNRPGNTYSSEIIKGIILTTRLFNTTPEKLPAIKVRAGLPSWILSAEVNISGITVGIDIALLVYLLEHTIPVILNEIPPPPHNFKAYMDFRIELN